MILKAASDVPPDWRAVTPAMAFSKRVLLSPPDYFEVRDVKNEFMRHNLGSVDRAEAMKQWLILRETFERHGVATAILPALQDCEDMVFTANPAFNGPGPDGKPVCIPARMAFPSRRPEVDAHRGWLAAHGYTVRELPASIERFEGGGDAVWHPGRALIWAAAGPRTQREAHGALAEAFAVPVVTLELTDPRFYHLDTCFCAIDERTVLIYPGAFNRNGLELIARVFQDVIAVGEEEAVKNMACNAAAFHGSVVIVQSGAGSTVSELRQRGFIVSEVETGEFLKSGGSVFCMKAALH